MAFSLMLPLLARFVAPVALIVVAVGIAIMRRAYVRRSRVGMVVGGGIVGVGAVVGAGAVYVIVIVGAIWEAPMTPEEEFFRAFMVRPEGQVTQIRSEITVSVDTNRQYLQFVTRREMLVRLVAGPFQRVGVDDCARRAIASKAHAPEWWAPAAVPGAECYVADPYSPYRQDAAWLLYDPATRQAHFHHDGR